jgi:hypothetical protein
MKLILEAIETKLAADVKLKLMLKLLNNFTSDAKAKADAKLKQTLTRMQKRKRC